MMKAGTSMLHKRKFNFKATGNNPRMKGARLSPEEIVSHKIKPEESRRDKEKEEEDVEEEVYEKEHANDSDDEPEEGAEGEISSKETDDSVIQLVGLASGRKFSHGYNLVEGKMPHGMEDYVVAKKKIIHGFELGLYAIFDGHSGRDVAKYLQTHLFDNILSEPDFWENLVSTVKRAYKSTDRDILKNVSDFRGGSTAVTTIVINGVRLLVAHVGNSRAVVCCNGVAKGVTVDHEPEKEKDVIESRGGFVSYGSGNFPHVDGQLAMARAFGDGKLKEHISAEADVRIQEMDDATEFLVLASDGLWKVMSNQEAYDCIKGCDDPEEASKLLIKEALSRHSFDDISCIVVVFL